MNIIFTDKAPNPAGHYSQAIEYKGIIYVSGILPVGTLNNEQKIASIEVQAQKVFDHLDEILRAAESDQSLVLKTTVYISDINLWDSVNAVYSKYFGGHKPARVIVPVNTLHHGFNIELEVIAAKR